GTAPGSTALSDPMEDPVVGWVVIVSGPGQGASLTLGYGMNSIGRAPTERISLDFGDPQISRTSHASITYDPRGKKYFINHGGGKNLTYLGEDPVLTPIELKGGEEVMIGDTTLRFVPFCGEDFDWRDK
ncbi:MAG: FHA domain-containing protein, partial [Chromatiales bacterium]